MHEILHLLPSPTAKKKLDPKEREITPLGTSGIKIHCYLDPRATLDFLDAYLKIRDQKGGHTLVPDLHIQGKQVPIKNTNAIRAALKCGPVCSDCGRVALCFGLATSGNPNVASLRLLAANEEDEYLQPMNGAKIVTTAHGGTAKKENLKLLCDICVRNRSFHLNAIHNPQTPEPLRKNGRRQIVPPATRAIETDLIEPAPIVVPEGIPDSIHAICAFDAEEMVMWLNSFLWKPGPTIPGFWIHDYYVPLSRGTTFSRLQLFSRKGLDCVTCNRTGSLYILYGVPDQPKQIATLRLMAHRTDQPSGGYVEMTRDHITPRSDGGGNTIANLQPMCEKCNQAKGNLPNDIFILKKQQIQVNKPSVVNHEKTPIVHPQLKME